MVTTCETKRRFRTCGKPGMAVCQYCGRSFCDEHGERLEDGQEICDDNNCAAKRDDLVRYFAYREEAERRNEEQLCGQTECGSGPQIACAKCRASFCAEHVRDRDFEQRDGTPGRGPVCDYCEKRRKIWRR